MKRKLLIVLITIFAFYLFLIFQANDIQTFSTFPAVGNNYQDITFFENNSSYEEINLDDGKGNNINGLYLGTGTGKTVYYFHGNGGPLSMFYSEIKYINGLGYNVIAYDYPGYGLSGGIPNKDNVDNFSQVFYDFVKKEKNIIDKELIIWGYSVGTAVSIDFASKNIFDKLVLVSPFSSRYDMGKSVFGFTLNKYLLLKDSYISKKLVKKFNKPVLIIHGNNDKIVPFNQGKLVFENYSNFKDITEKPNKYFIEIDDFGHNGIIDNFGKVLKYKIGDFLKNGEIKFNDEYILLNKDGIQENDVKKDKIRAKIERKRKMHIFLDRLRIKKLEEENKKIFLRFEKDSSYTKFVNNKVHFNKISYIPTDLVQLKGNHLIDVKGYQLLRNKALEALKKLSYAFYKEFKTDIRVVSAYRSYKYQKGIKDRGCPDNLCAKAGYSEHQSGLAVDLWEASTKDVFLSKSRLKKYFEWMNKNAQNYGFHNSYQNGVTIDGYDIEPWHWRYLGVDLAQELKEKDLTFAEYYKLKE